MTNDEVLAESNKELLIYLEREGYKDLRVLEDGTIVGTIDLLYTRAIFIGLNSLSWEKRFCFQDRDLASSEVKKLVTGDDEPSGFIARRNA